MIHNNTDSERFGGLASATELFRAGAGVEGPVGLPAAWLSFPWLIQSSLQRFADEKPHPSGSSPKAGFVRHVLA